MDPQKDSSPEPRGDEPTQAHRLLGRVLDERYRIESLLGEGGIGRVYRAQHLRLKRPVAVKVLLEEYQLSPPLKKRFEREAMALAALAHPNIVTILDFGSDGDTTYLVMELVDGGDLAALLEDGPLPPRTAFDIMAQVLSSLAYAHSNDVIHRDLKPANVLVRALPGGTDHVTILDFGLAKFMDKTGPSADLTKTGIVLGTPAYMAPEQATGAAVDARSDVYSAGLLFYELLTGHRLFDIEDPAELLRAHMITPPPRLSATMHRVHVAPELDAFLQKALAKTAADRFTDGGAMLAAFQGLPTDAIRSTVTSPDEPSIGSAPTRKLLSPALGVAPIDAPVITGGRRTMSRRNALLPIALGAAVVLLGAIVTALVWPQPGDDFQPSVEVAPEPAAPELPAEPAMPADSLALPEPEPEPAPEPPPEPEATAPEEPEVAPADEEAAPEDVPAPEAGRPRLPPADPWAARPPPVHRSFLGMLKRGRVPTDRQLRSLRTYQRANRDDPRTHLVYAYVYMQRGWYSAAVRQYRNAYRLDTSVRGDVRMKSDLIRLVALEGSHADAVPLVMEIYEPDEIRAELELMISRTGDDAEAARLGVLRALLER